MAGCRPPKGGRDDPSQPLAGALARAGVGVLVSGSPMLHIRIILHSRTATNADPDSANGQAELSSVVRSGKRDQGTLVSMFRGASLEHCSPHR